MAIGLQTSIWENRLKTIYLIVLMPVLVFIFSFISLIFTFKGINDQTIYYSIQFYLYFIPMFIIWFLLSFFLNKSIVFAHTGSEFLDRKRCPEIYNIVENLCISRGLPTPKIGIINDDSLNAFATGRGVKNSYIVFSRGLLAKLTNSEIRSVAAHELTHIINGDIKIMFLSNVFIGVIFIIGEVLLKISGPKDKKGTPLLFLGIAFYLLGFIILPLVNLAISRKREFLADAGSVELTMDRDSMMSALLKIQKDSNIEGLQKNSLAPMFIYDPKEKSYLDSEGNRKVKTSIFGSFFSTHPTVEERIKALETY